MEHHSSIEERSRHIWSGTYRSRAVESRHETILPGEAGKTGGIGVFSEGGSVSLSVVVLAAFFILFLREVFRPELVEVIQQDIGMPNSPLSSGLRFLPTFSEDTIRGKSPPRSRLLAARALVCRHHTHLRRSGVLRYPLSGAPPRTKSPTR